MADFRPPDFGIPRMGVVEAFEVERVGKSADAPGLQVRQLSYLTGLPGRPDRA